MTQKITMRDFLIAVAESNIDPWIKDFAAERVQELDEENAKRAEKSSTQDLIDMAYLSNVFHVFNGNEVLTIRTITKRLREEDDEITSPKVTKLVRLGVELGAIEKIIPVNRYLPLKYKLAD